MRNQRLGDFGDSGDWDTTPIAGRAPAEGFFKTAYRGRKIVLAVTACCLAVAVGYLLLAPRQYTSTARIYVEQEGPTILSDTSGVMTQSKNYLHTQCELLKFTPILEAALQTPGLRQIDAIAGADDPIRRLKQDLTVELGKKDDLISVSYDSEFPEDSTLVVGSVVEAYLDYHTSQKKSWAGRILDILQKEKSARETELNTKLAENLAFQKANGDLWTADSGPVAAIEPLKRISQAIADVQLEAIEARADREVIQRLASDPARLEHFLVSRDRYGAAKSLSAGAEILGERARQLQLKLSDLRSQCTDDHPAVVALRGQIAEVNSQMASDSSGLAEACLAVASQREASAYQKEAELRELFEDQRIATAEINYKGAQYAVLQSEVKRAERICEVLDEKIKELNIAEDTGALNINVVEPARAESVPTSPSPARAIPVAAALGLVLGVGIVFVRKHIDKRFQSAEDIVDVLDLPVLGSVPTEDADKSQFERFQVMAIDPASPSAEAYRAIRTATCFGATVSKVKTLLVTSGRQGEGKSTLVTNLSIATAQAGRRTLILDCDLRRPAQHNAFSIRQEPGLSNVVLQGENLAASIQQTEVKGLDILTAGTTPCEPSELLSSARFSEVFDWLAGSYDRVILDAPPAAAVTDASVLATMCDATVLTVSAGSSIRSKTRQARNALVAVGAKMLGVVVVGAPAGDGRYGHYWTGYDDGDDHKGGSTRSGRSRRIKASARRAWRRGKSQAVGAGSRMLKKMSQVCAAVPKAVPKWSPWEAIRKRAGRIVDGAASSFKKTVAPVTGSARRSLRWASRQLSSCRKAFAAVSRSVTTSLRWTSRQVRFMSISVRRTIRNTSRLLDFRSRVAQRVPIEVEEVPEMPRRADKAKFANEVVIGK